MQLECDYHVIQEQCREAIRMTTHHDVALSSPHPPVDATPPDGSWLHHVMTHLLCTFTGSIESSGSERSSEKETQSSDEVSVYSILVALCDEKGQDLTSLGTMVTWHFHSMGGGYKGIQ